MKKGMLKKFFYWMNERHSIYLKKEAGEEWPWTKDKILQEYKFTNVFRQLDAVTKELTKRLKGTYSVEDIFTKIIIFRMFNWPPTYDILNDHGLIKTWNTKKAIKVLNKYAAGKNKVFTGAYIITNNGLKDSKISLVCNSIGKILADKYHILANTNRSLEHTNELLMGYPMVGGFIGYELVTDLRHTKVLNSAKDIMTWANPGPGAKRGLNRIYGRDLKKSQPDALFIEEMRTLLSHCNLELEGSTGVQLLSLAADNCALELRDIEHSLCEFDKYTRVKNGEGRPRSKYKGGKK